MDLERGGLQRRRDLLTAGFADDEVRRRLRGGQLALLRRGVYLPSAAMPDQAVDRHVLSVHAAIPSLARDVVVSHVSAAVLHGLAVWNVPLDRVHVTRSRRSGARRTQSLHVHAASVEPDEIVLVDGVAVTSVARTVADLARSLPFEQAVVIADSALDAGGGQSVGGSALDAPGRLTGAALKAAVARSARRPGNPTARRVVGFADGRSKSVGESRSRDALHRAGLPAPDLQWEVWSATGRRIGWTDFGWPDLRTVGEFDGRVKYGRLLRAGQDPGDAVFAEKLREDALRDTGLRVVRWVWRDLDHFDVVVERLRRAFEAR